MEELQSTNEELAATNDELRSRTLEINRLNQFLETVTASVKVSIIVLDPGLRVRLWNRQSFEMWGLAEEEVVGSSFLGLDTGLPRDLLARTHGGPEGRLVASRVSDGGDQPAGPENRLQGRRQPDATRQLHPRRGDSADRAGGGDPGRWRPVAAGSLGVEKSRNYRLRNVNLVLTFSHPW